MRMYHLLVSVLLVAVHINTSSARASPIDGELIFDPTEYYYEMPASCANDNFCFDKGDKYPEGKIEKLLNNMRELPMGPSIGTETSFGNRYGDEPNENSDCPTNSTFVDKPIYYIYDTANKLRVVIQSKKIQQIYSVKWCKYPGPINRNTEHFVRDSLIHRRHTIECVNTIMDYDFFVLSEFDDKIETAKAKDGIPVCCRCRYSKSNNDHL